MIYRRWWISIAALVALATTVLCWLYLPKTRPDEKAVRAVEDQVYEAVVRDMVTPVDGQAQISQLVFDDTLLTDPVSGADIGSCKEDARKHFGMEGYTPPQFNSLADKIYRVFTRGGYENSARGEAIQDFLSKSCIVGALSKTFHTDLPRTFISVDNVHFKDWPVDKNGSKSFEQLFPGASGIISFSHVGFDSTLHEAIVSTSFICGGLCGTGHRCVLKKKWGRWEVANKWIAWVS